MKTLLIFFLIVAAPVAYGHKFYISIADMEYDSTGQRINVTLKVTAHDFEQVLRRKFDKPIHLEEYTDSSEVGHYIQQYLKHNFKLYSSDKQLEMIYLGREVTNRDDLYFYFFFKDVPDFTSIKIVNKLLFSVSDQQQNIVHYQYKNHTKSVTLVPAKSEDWITFGVHDD